MISLKSSHNRSLIAVLSLVALAAVACSSSTGDATTVTATQPSSGSGDAATAQGTQANSTSPTQTPAIGGSTQPPAAPVPTALDRIAFTSTDGSVYTIDADGSNRQRVNMADAGIPGTTFAAFYGWPAWSPDGRHLLISAFTPDIAGGLETSLLRTSATIAEANPELLYRDVPGTNGIGGVPHFPVWHPDGGSVALIANLGDGLVTFLIDVEDGLGPAVSNGAPVYLEWSSDGSHMLVHTSERLVLHAFDSDGKRTGTEQIGVGSVSYRVPKFAPGSDEYAYIDLSDGVRTLLIGAPSQPSPRQVRPALANNSVAWSPVGHRLAFAEGTRGAFYDTLHIIDPNGDAESDVQINRPILAFWWSPDGQNILVAMPRDEPENVALAVVDAETGDFNFLGLADPSPEMGFVIGFFDQYAADLHLWSPDSTRFIFSGILKDGLSDEAAGTQVQFGDPDSEVWVIDPSGLEKPISLGAGTFGTWSPE